MFILLACIGAACSGPASTTALANPAPASSAPSAAASAISIVSGDKQVGPPGGLVPKALVVKVIGKNGRPSPEHPVSFEVTEGALQKSSIGKLTKSLTVLTDQEGQAKVFFQLPKVKSHSCQVTCSIGTGANARKAAFTQSSDDGSGEFTDPFDATDVVANVNPDGSMDVTWTNNTDPADPEPVKIQYQDRDGKWKTLLTAPAGSTSWHVPSPQDSPTPDKPRNRPSSRTESSGPAR